MIINLTQHPATPEQIDAGVVDFTGDDRETLTRLLTVPATTLVGGLARVDIQRRVDTIVSRMVLPELERAAHAIAISWWQAGEQGYGPPTAAEAFGRLYGFARNSGLKAMIGGLPAMMRPLEEALIRVGVMPVYAVSERESAEQAMPDGSVRKVNVFRHMGFVRPAGEPL
jgi:hypothetical protein